MPSVRIALCMTISLLISMPSKALTPTTLCIWDPVGTHGPVFSFFFDLKVKAINWGVDLDMLAFESELEALEQLEHGQCDVSIVTAILARDYVHFGGSLDAIGAVRSQDQLKLLITTLTSPKIRPALQQDEFEIAAVLPVGPMYAFVNDREISELYRFKNKKISALNADIQTKKLAKVSGAKSLNTNISNFAEQFKSGSIDIVLMPAIAYTAFELDQAMRNAGGVIDIRFFNGMLQAIANRNKVDDHFSVHMRQYMNERIQDIFKLIQTAENDIPEHYWIKTKPELKTALQSLFKDIRLELMVENKLDRRALKLLWRIRCKTEKEHPECIG